MAPDPDKVRDIQEAPAPSNISEVRSFLGMVNFCWRFIPDLTNLTKHLRELTKSATTWQWGPDQEQAFKDSKAALSAVTTLSYFDPARPTNVAVDASPYGLGAVLTQQRNEEWAPIAYASRSLTETEQRYSQIEREAIAIQWACRHFHIYVYGHPFTVSMDHKPLIPLFQGSASKPPPRIEKWILQLQGYDYRVEYKPGSSNSADYLSRHPRAVTKAEEEDAEDTEEYVRFIAERSQLLPMSLEAIVEATRSDECLQLAITAVRTNDWCPVQTTMTLRTPQAKTTLESIMRIKEELSVDSSGCLLRGPRLVIQSNLAQQAVDLAHRGHQGVVKTKGRLRAKVWFPGMDSMVEQTVRTCQWCQVSGHPDRPHPVITEDNPRPWECVIIDFGHLPEGRYALVVIDDYTKYPEIEVVGGQTAKEVITKMEKIIATHGIFEVVKTDNGLPFQGQEFADYLKSWGIQHRKVTLHWPQANGEVERYMRTLNKVICIAHAEEVPLERAIYSFLREYRLTPHLTTERAPGPASMGRVVRDTIPHHPNWAPSQIDSTKVLAKRTSTNKQASVTRAKESTIRERDMVYVKDRHPGSKFRLPFEERPWTVTRRTGTMVTAWRGTGELTRNVSFFKKVHAGTPNLPILDSVEDTPSQRVAEEGEGSQRNIPMDDSDVTDGGPPSPFGALDGERSSSPVRSPDGRVSQEVAPSPTSSRGEHSRYCLRSNLAPSSHLAGFMV